MIGSMKYFLLFILLLCAITLESTIIQLPLVLLVLLIFTIVFQDEWIFSVGIFSGFVLDALQFRIVGSSSLFFLVFLLLVFLYERKFELRSVWFVLIMSGVGSLLFFVLFGSSILVMQTLMSVLMGLILFTIVIHVFPLPDKEELRSWKK